MKKQRRMGDDELRFDNCAAGFMCPAQPPSWATCLGVQLNFLLFLSLFFVSSEQPAGRPAGRAPQMGAPNTMGCTLVRPVGARQTGSPEQAT